MTFGHWITPPRGRHEVLLGRKSKFFTDLEPGVGHLLVEDFPRDLLLGVRRELPLGLGIVTEVDDNDPASLRKAGLSFFA